MFSNFFKNREENETWKFTSPAREGKPAQEFLEIETLVKVWCQQPGWLSYLALWRVAFSSVRNSIATPNFDMDVISPKIHIENCIYLYELQGREKICEPENLNRKMSSCLIPKPLLIWVYDVVTQDWFGCQKIGHGRWGGLSSPPWLKIIIPTFSSDFHFSYIQTFVK